ncbi:MAG: T9SS type A sorting domain-containing protein [Bacteroidota bacterium]
MKQTLLAIITLFAFAQSGQSQCTVNIDPSTIIVTQDSTIASDLGNQQFYLVCQGVTLTYEGTQSAKVTYYLEDAASVISQRSHEAILYMKRLSSIDANYSENGKWAITKDAWYDPTAQFIDHVQGSNFNECAEVVFNYGSVGNCSGTAAIKEESRAEFHLLPNPTDDYLTIQFSQSEERRITVLNVLGKEMQSINTQEEEITLDVRELKSGTYFVAITSGQGKQSTKKLIIQK